MDFSFSDDQEQLIRAVDRWVERAWNRGDASSGDHRRAGWAELTGHGWTGLLSPTSFPLLDAVLVVEQLAHRGCPLPMGPGGMVAPLVAELAGLPLAGGPETLLVGDGTSAGRGLELADRVVVVAPGAAAPGSGRTWAATVVPLPPDGGAVEVVQDEGRTVLSRLRAPVGPDRWRPLDRAAGELAWLAGAVLSAAEVVGSAQAVLDQCVDYAKVRVQGGRPIGGHQAIQHRLADMLGGIERARYLTYQAAVSLADAASTGFDPDRVPAEVHRAKALAARDGLAAIRSGHQVMGAIAYSAEHDLHHRHKQAVVAAHDFGGPAWHWAALERAAHPTA